MPEPTKPIPPEIDELDDDDFDDQPKPKGKGKKAAPPKRPLESLEQELADRDGTKNLTRVDIFSFTKAKLLEKGGISEKDAHAQAKKRAFEMCRDAS